MSLPLEIPPGILKVDSPNAGKGRFTDSDKIRFENGFAEKWAGWELFNNTQLEGKTRGAAFWTNQYGNPNAAFGTTVRLYALTGTDTITDITPVRDSGTLGSNPFTTTNASAVVTVADTSHAASAGDYVTFDGATAVGGITIDGQYQITTIINPNSYTITHSAAATSSATGGGASVTYAYNIANGPESSTAGLGWGSGRWGEGTWGTERTDGLVLALRHWSLAPYGNDLLAVPSGGTLYLWQEATDPVAEKVTNAPAAIRAMFVTGERFIFLLGTATPMTVQWPDRDDITDYTPSSSNTANSRVLQEGSVLVAGTALTDGVSLVWSDTATYLFQYTGSEFIYDSRMIAKNSGLIGPLAFTVAQGTAYWMSSSEFYMFNGSVVQVPRSDEIKGYVFRNLDQSYADKSWALYDETTNQVRFHYCSSGSTEPNRYVDVNLDGTYDWTVGTLDRTSGTQFEEGVKSTLLVSSDGYIYQHGVGTDADGAAMEAYITYGLYAIANGDANVDIMGLIPDMTRQTGDITYELYTKERPNSSSNFDSKTLTLSETTEIEDARLEGRHFGMTIRSNVVGGDFRLGIPKLEIQQSGERR